MDMEMTEKLKALEAQVGVIKDEALRKIAFEKLLEAALPAREAVASGTKAVELEVKENDADIGEFFAQIQHDKPAENAVALAAFYYSQYGSIEFSIAEMNSLSREVGVTIPERLDMTYLAAQRDGKNLFRRSGRGAFKPTVYGEAHFKKTYQATKGRKVKPAQGS